MQAFGGWGTWLITGACLLLLALLGLIVVALSRRKVGRPGRAGWLPDPSGQYEMRFWDGTRWTEDVSDPGAQGETRR